jgi:hypothetical protein
MKSKKLLGEKIGKYFEEIIENKGDIKKITKNSGFNFPPLFTILCFIVGLLSLIFYFIGNNEKLLNLVFFCAGGATSGAVSKTKKAD